MMAEYENQNPMIIDNEMAKKVYCCIYSLIHIELNWIKTAQCTNFNSSSSLHEVCSNYKMGVCQLPEYTNVKSALLYWASNL